MMGKRNGKFKRRRQPVQRRTQSEAHSSARAGVHYGTAPLIDGGRDKRPSQQPGSANGPIGGTVPLDPPDKSVPPWDGTGRDPFFATHRGMGYHRPSDQPHSRAHLESAPHTPVSQITSESIYLSFSRLLKSYEFESAEF